VPHSELYTGRGDDGFTGLLGPERVPKHDLRPEAYGTVDEVQAVLGVARASGCTQATAEVVLSIQKDLHRLMAELAGAGSEKSAFSGSITQEHVGRLEGWIAETEARVELPRAFVVPGDSKPGAFLHHARTVARRAERRVVHLAHEGFLPNDDLIRYLNRLSSLLFALACAEDQAVAGTAPSLAEGDASCRR
jgi:cob(I)alamin adenosyltransferase